MLTPNHGLDQSTTPPHTHKQVLLPVLTSRSLFLGTISPFLVPIWSLFHQTGPYSAKIVVQTRNIIPEAEILKFVVNVIVKDLVVTFSNSIL